MKKTFLIKYGEIAIKGKNRYLFENALVRALKRSVRDVGKFTVKKEQGRIFVEPEEESIDGDLVIQRLTKVFGVVGVCPVIMTENMDFENIKKVALDYVQETYGDAKLTFKVEARRSNKQYPLDSMGIAREVGGFLLDHMSHFSVDVHDPDIRVWVEIRNAAYIYSKVIPGPGGMPFGTNGKAMLLLSGGIDSPVAGWMIGKRGVEVEGIYFHSHPYTSDRAKQKVIDLAKKIAIYTGEFALHIVPFTDIQLYIYDQCPHEQLTIIMRRIMMRIAEKVAVEREALALITGESVGQVASQTIHSLSVTNSVCTLPVFRPLIGFDKQDIVDIAEKIDTYETSILPYEDCCTIFVAKHPETRPRLDKIEHSEKSLTNIEKLIDESIKNIEVIQI